MAPLVLFTIWATPWLPLPPWVSVGHSTVEPDFSVHALGAAATRYLVKFSVVPEPSERWATVTSVEGSLTPGFNAAMAGSSHFLIWRWKSLAMVSASRVRSFTSPRLWETVSGAAVVGR